MVVSEAFKHRALKLPRWASVALSVQTARRVQILFDGWMSEEIYHSITDEALRFVEKLVISGGGVPKCPLQLPDQMSKLIDGAAAAARSTYEDHLNPDAMPSGYVSAARAAEMVAEGISHLLKSAGYATMQIVRDRIRASLTAFIEAKTVDAARTFQGYEYTKQVERQAKQRFVHELSTFLENLEHESFKQDWNEFSGIQWSLFCSTDPFSSRPQHHRRYVRSGVRFFSVFISYSHRDAEFVQWLFDEPKKRGVECWLDEHAIKPGERILSAVDKGIRASDRVVLCCSKESLASWWVQD